MAANTMETANLAEPNSRAVQAAAAFANVAPAGVECAIAAWGEAWGRNAGFPTGRQATGEFNCSREATRACTCGRQECRRYASWDAACRCNAGVTLIELLVVIAITGVLAGLLLPALGRAKSSGQSAACMNNLKQLQLGYLSYVHDNDDRFPLNRARAFGLGDVRNVEGSWVLGNAARDTNTANIKQGTIFRYVDAAAVYRCPADRSKVAGTSLPRTRSYSVEGWLNAYYTANGFDFGIELYPWAKYKLAELLDPPPAGVFAFIEEHEQSIDAGVFVLVQPYRVTGRDGSREYWYSLPADRHQQGGNLSFLDGRVEHWRWKAPKVFRQFSAPARHDADDLRRLQEAIPHNVTPK